MLGPITQADVVTVEDDKGIRIFVLDNDLDGPDPIDPEALTIVVEPLHADSFRVHDDHIHYKSEKDYEGVDVIVYEVCDVAGVCSTGTLTITVED